MSRAPGDTSDGGWIVREEGSAKAGGRMWFLCSVLIAIMCISFDTSQIMKL